METRRSLRWMIAVVAGTTAMVIANQAGHGGDLLSPAQYLAPMGAIVGVAAGVVVFLLTRLLATSSKARFWGSLAAAIVMGLFGLLVSSWNLAWGVPLLSLEGSWLWPLAMTPLILSFLLFRGLRRTRPDAAGAISK